MVFSEEDEEKLEYTDVYLLNTATDKFEILPRKMATPITNSYIEYIASLGEGYMYFDKQNKRKEKDQ